MNHIVLMASLMLLFPQHNQNFPDEFFQIPEPVRERATLVASATFAKGRTPCMWRPDGMRVWAIDSSFHIKKVYRGDVGSKFISINLGKAADKRLCHKRKVKREYLVLLQPGAEKMKAIKKNRLIAFWDALGDEEIIAIIELK